MAKIVNQFLGGEDLCSSISGVFTEQLVPYTVRKLKKNEILWHDNERHQYCYFVKNGLLKLYVIDKDGREKALFYYTKGSLLGFQSLSKEKVTMTTAEAILPTTLYAIEFSLLFDLIAVTPECLNGLISYIFHHMAVEAQEIVNISLYNTAERLAALLVILADEYQEKRSSKMLIPFKNEELGAMVGASRNSISNALSVFHSQGMIRKHRGGLLITDLEQLKNYSQ